jgi:hypothetical protein
MTEKINGKIYKIQNKFNPKLFYIGSTIQALNERLSVHKLDSKTKNSTLYNVVRNTNGWKNYNMILIKDFACNDREELYKEEQVYINALQPTMNEKNAYTTEEEKKECMKEYIKEYYENNKKRIKKKQSAPITCNCGAIITTSNISYHRKTKKHLNLLNK